MLRQRLSTLVVILYLLAAPAFSQIETATITGRVSDPTGAVIPAVRITVVNTATNFKFTGQTNEQGIFRIQSLQPGPYRVSMQATGFKTIVQDNIDLRTGDVKALDQVMEVGAVSEQVEVTGQAPLLETETSATGTVVEGTTVYNLPIYQRYVNSTLQLVPGMTQSGYGYGRDLGAFHIAGQRNTSIGFYEDGVAANDAGAGTTTPTAIQNALSEVKVLTTTLPAEYGHSAGGILSVVTKTGTNSFHGLASDFGRSRSMTQRRFFDKCRNDQNEPAQGCAPTDYLFMEPDANGGGPVVIPHLYNGRNRTFWFVAWQHLIEKKVNQFYQNSPTPEMLNGDFNFGGIGRPIYDPATTRLQNGTWVRDALPNKQVPLSRFDPVARKILSYNPWTPPNLPQAVTSAGPNNNMMDFEPSRTFFEDYLGRIDHQFNEAFKIYGSYSYNHSSGLGRPYLVRVRAMDGDQGNLTPQTAQTYSIGQTYVITPTLIDDAKVGFYRLRNDKIVPSYMQGWPQTLGIPNVPGDLFPNFNVFGLTVSGPTRNISETISFRDDLTKVYGTHAFKVGYELLRFRINNISVGYPSGNYNFGGVTAGLQDPASGGVNGATSPNTGNDFAGFLLGYVGQASYSTQLADWEPRAYINSFYVQDDWKATPQLTLNLGVRYSNESPFNTKYGNLSNFDPNGSDTLVPGGRGVITHTGQPLYGRDNNNFQPRVGVAWHPLRRWVFRGGFALQTVDVKFPLSRGNFDEYTTNANVQSPPGNPTPGFQISNGPPSIPYVIRSNDTSPYSGTNYSGRSVEWWDPGLRNPYVLNWNQSIQYEFSPTYLLELSYQGTAGVGLLERWQVNTFPIDFAANDPTLRAQVAKAPQNYRPYPNYGDINFRCNCGHSTWHAGTIKLEKRYSSGTTFETFYQFSKALDEQDGDNSGGGVAPIQNRRLEKGRAGFDRNHRFSGHITYELPIGKGHRFLNRGGILDYLFGGWQIAWIQSAETGNPLTFGFANSPYNYYPTFAGAQRANVTGTAAIRSGWRDVGPDRFNTNNANPVIDITPFGYPAAFTPGNSGRNIVTGLPLIWSTSSAQKNFRFKERFNFQVRLDYNNTLKTFCFDPPTTTVDLKNPQTFGKISSDQRTANWGGEPLMNLTLALRW